MMNRFSALLLVTFSVHLFAAESQTRIVMRSDFDEYKSINVVSPTAIGQSELIEIEIAHADLLEQRREGSYVQIVNIDVDNLAREIVDTGVLIFTMPDGEAVRAFRDSLVRWDVPGDPGYQGWSWQGYIFDGAQRDKDERKVLRLAIDSSSVAGQIPYQGKVYSMQLLGPSGYHTLSQRIPGYPVKLGCGIGARDPEEFNEEVRKECERIKARDKSHITCPVKE